MLRRASLAIFLLATGVALPGCERSRSAQTTDSQATDSQTTASQSTASLPDEPSPPFRNVETHTSYVGDAACSTCHAREASAYRQHAMAQTFHRWTRANHIETPLEKPLYHPPTGFSYSVVDTGGRLYQVEHLIGPGGKRLHELRRRMDYVMGSGNVALTYFTEENGRLFQLPLTWYRTHGWDFSPGYEINNARFDRLMPDRCIACHSSYPRPLPFLEGKYAELRPGIGCERCHGPGALHVKERRAAVRRDGAYDRTIVNPARLPLARRLDVCEQCHVHTDVAVFREGKNAFSYVPSQPLGDQAAFFKAGGIDIVSHADRLRQSKCFIASRTTSRPLECATCHDPHLPASAVQTRNQSCQSCHLPAALQQRLARSASLPDHTPTSDCVGCHMPRVQVRAAVHGAFTDHWIRVTTRAPEPAAAQQYGDGLIEPYYERDKTGPDAGIYQGMGKIVYATLANNGRVLSSAVAELDRALGKDTTRGDAHFLLGVADEQLGKTDDAIRALERSVRIDSNRPEALRALAKAYERAGRNPTDIERLYQRALAAQPALAWIRAEYADFLHAEERRSDAERFYRSALAEEPSRAVAWFNLGTLLAEEQRLRESSRAFQEAVHLDPSLAQALSPLFEIHAAGKVVTGVKNLGSPLPSLPARERGPRAVQLTVSSDAATPGLTFLNVPARGFVRILKPDGTLVRALPTTEAWTLSWDLRAETGNPIAGGLYRAFVQGRDESGRTLAPQFLYFGVVRQRKD
jgi:tetratricopeptide (TPR) repeat protein